MLRIDTVDRLACSGTSWLHRSSPGAKWLLIGSAVGSAIVSIQAWPLIAGYGLLALAAASGGLPLGALLLTSLLPVPMFGLVAVSQWDGSLSTPVTIIAKGTLTALAGLLVAVTTPYPDLLAPATRVLPPVLADSLVLTYRALFILWSRVEMLWLAVRVRGAFFRRPRAGLLPWEARGTSLRRRIDVGTVGLSLAVLRGADLSTRLYDVMRLRGYRGRLAPTRSLAFRAADWRLVALGVLLLGLSAVARWRVPSLG